MRSTTLAPVGAQPNWELVDLLCNGERYHLRPVGEEPGDRFGDLMNEIVKNHMKVCYEDSISVGEMHAFLGCMLVMWWGQLSDVRTPHRSDHAEEYATQMMLSLLRNPAACGLELGRVFAGQ